MKLYLQRVKIFRCKTISLCIKIILSLPFKLAQIHTELDLHSTFSILPYHHDFSTVFEDETHGGHDIR